MDRAIRPLLLLRRATPSKSADDTLYDAGFTYHSTDSSRGSKEAAARRVLANTIIETYLPLLCRFPDIPFVMLSELFLRLLLPYRHGTQAFQAQALRRSAHISR